MGMAIRSTQDIDAARAMANASLRGSGRPLPSVSTDDNVGQWYIVHGAPIAVERRLLQFADMGDPWPVQLFIPKERITTGSGRMKRVRDLPLFGNYFFANLDLTRTDRESESASGILLDSFKSIDGVSGFLGKDASGWPRPFDHMEIFRRLLRTPVVERKAAPITVGMAVRILVGPFAGRDGVVEEVLGCLDKNQRVAILQSIFGRSTRLELPVDHVEMAQSG